VIYSKNFFNKQFIVLLVATLIFSYFEILYFEIDHLMPLEDDLRRLGYYVNVRIINVVYSTFPSALAVLLGIFKYSKKYIYSTPKLLASLFFYKLAIISILFYFLRIYTISRPRILISSVIFALLFATIITSFNKNFKNSILSIIIFIFLAQLHIVYDFIYEVKFNNCINSFSGNNIFDSFSSESNSIYVIGHAYGSAGTATSGMSKKVNDFIDKETETLNSTLVLTGDIVYENNIDSLSEVKKNIEKNFKDYLIAPGNHDIQNNNNYFTIFNEDLFLRNSENFLLIAANFSTDNWLPSIENQKKINNYIKEKEIDTIFLFSHQLFWIKDTGNEIVPNGTNLLKTDLQKHSTNWLQLDGKKLIIISGDFGANGQESYCKKVGNIIFIADGIGDKINDNYIKISFDQKGFYLTKRGF
tara:strand:+ start:1083 stop:2330 length:1248 start_codon:yes stop_codon:yes gene_type:complete